MSEEQEQSSEAPAENSGESQTETQNTDPMEQFYADEGINVDEAAQQFTAQPGQNEAQPQPDPYVDNYDYDGTQAQAALVGQMQSSLSEVRHMQEQMAEQVVEADIGKAVDRISKDIEGLDKAVIEAHLQAEAKTDPRFRGLWDNRQANPKAWDRAVEAKSRKMQGQYTVKQDPQLTENQRAAKQSQQSMAATNNTQSNDWADKSEEQIAADVAAIKRDGF